MDNEVYVTKIYNYCFRLLGLKPYTENEIRQKIKGRFKDIQESIVDEVLEKLKELKYINDAEFSLNYINYRSSISPRGRFLLKQELKKKGVSEDLISQALEEVNLDEIALAQKLSQHKNKSLQSLDPQKRKEKLMRFLQSRGFSYDVIKEVI